jgi:CHAD domain-containing protein
MPDAAADPIELLGPAPHVAHGATAGDVVRAAIDAATRQLLEHVAVTRRGGADDHAVHQARVAARRLRSDLRSFRPFVDAAWSDSLRDDLRWLGAALGRARDADVLLARLEARAGALPDADQLAVDAVLDRLRAQRAEARARLLAALDDPRAAALADRLVAAARAPRLSGEASRPASVVLPRIVRRPWRDLARAHAALGDHPSDHALHEMRILAKRCRYAAEASAPALGAPARRLARAVARVQDVLGEHQDAVVAREWLAKAAADLPAAEAFAAGVLAGLEVTAARDARAAFPAAWRRAHRRRPGTWR